MTPDLSREFGGGLGQPQRRHAPAPDTPATRPESAPAQSEPPPASGSPLAQEAACPRHPHAAAPCEHGVSTGQIDWAQVWPEFTPAAKWQGEPIRTAYTLPPYANPDGAALLGRDLLPAAQRNAVWQQRQRQPITLPALPPAFARVAELVREEADEEGRGPRCAKCAKPIRSWEAGVARDDWDRPAHAACLQAASIGPPTHETPPAPEPKRGPMPLRLEVPR